MPRTNPSTQPDHCSQPGRWLSCFLRRAARGESARARMARKDRTRRPQGQGQTRRPLTSWLGAAVTLAVVCTALAYRLLLPADDHGDLCTSPRVWLQPDFLSAAEVDQLLAESAGVGAECWDEVSETQQTAMLESCPRLATTAYAIQGSNPGLADARQVCYSHVWALPWTG